MSTSPDATKDIDERATERMNFRTKPHIKATIQRAAALSGVDERTVLEPVDHAAFFNALDNPAQAKPKLREAFERHQKRVVSR